MKKAKFTRTDIHAVLITTGTKPDKARELAALIVYAGALIAIFSLPFLIHYLVFP